MDEKDPRRDRGPREHEGELSKAKLVADDRIGRRPREIPNEGARVLAAREGDDVDSVTSSAKSFHHERVVDRAARPLRE
jgi:hypothetical protein